MIEINNLTTNPVDEEFFKKVAEKVLEEENKGGAELSIALVGQGRIKALNKKYLGKNRVTDVLAFAGDGYGLGEIVICLRVVKKNARRVGVTFEKELARVLIHGILHLLGYDHEKPEKEAKKMAEKENYYLNLIFK
ncbi:MAG: rRNA maturation RNase YbeY [Patescibacteria group bacterium]|nr:rRNA maturation RNase YbeY [Patescibacteria group bacterium]